MKINSQKLSLRLQEAVELVADHLEITSSPSGIKLQVAIEGEGIQVATKDDAAIISIEKEAYFLRALGLLVEAIRQGKTDINIKESPAYDSLEIMLDCSRNGVLNFKAYQEFAIHAALMGYTTIQLYMEDVYEIKGRPYFGYLRGRYSKDQLKEMDEYADSLFIELVPAIQTLAHLGEPLKWQEFADLVDFGDILLVGEDKTYQLIDDMFRTLSESIASRNINIGMDEAHMVGLGKYLDKHGYKDRFGIMLTHLNKVIEIANKYDYKPMMWSDMFFRLGSGGEYYDTDWEMRQDIVDAIPKEVSLVYWDYYSEDQESYDQMMAKHKEMTDKLVFAGGAWKWSGFTPANLYSHKIALPAHASCQENNIKRVIITAWGDNGAECSVFAILPTLQLWAELAYRDRGDSDHVAQRFKTCTSGDYEDFLTLDRPLFTPNNPAPGKQAVNPTKYILYQDILAGLLDNHIDRATYPLHFQKCSQALEEIIRDRPSKWNYIFETQKALCDVLVIKSHCGINIRTAYRSDNENRLKDYSQVFLPELLEKIDIFIDLYRKQWMTENKSFGLDVFDIRIGGLIQRIKTAQLVINQYINNEISSIEELEEDILEYSGKFNQLDEMDISVPLWHNIATVSNIESV